MSVPEHLWRFPTAHAIASLAARFGLPNGPHMQDWEWEVADPKRIEEFVAAYESGELSEDEQFTLMETIIQSFEESSEDLRCSDTWAHVLNLLDANIALHIYSVWYWSDLENDVDEHLFRVTPFVRNVLACHRSRSPVHLEIDAGAAVSMTPTQQTEWSSFSECCADRTIEARTARARPVRSTKEPPNGPLLQPSR